MFAKTKIALATALVLSSGVAALAASDASEERGGYVIEGSITPAAAAPVINALAGVKSYTIDRIDMPATPLGTP